MDQNPTTEPAAKSGDFLRLAVAHFGRDLAEDSERLDALIQQADDDDQPAVCMTLAEASVQLEDARFEAEKALGQFK